MCVWPKNSQLMSLLVAEGRCLGKVISLLCTINFNWTLLYCLCLSCHRQLCIAVEICHLLGLGNELPECKLPKLENHSDHPNTFKGSELIKYLERCPSSLQIEMKLVSWRKLAVVSELCCWPCNLPPQRHPQLQISLEPIPMTPDPDTAPWVGHCGAFATSETSKRAVVLQQITS